MSRDRPTDRLLIWVCSVAVLAGSAALLGWLTVGAVDHVTAEDQPAVITDVSGSGSRTTIGRHRRERTISFRLEDGTQHADSVRSRWTWWPHEGDTIHVHQVSADDWEISEAFSWPATVGSAAFALLPWLFVLLKAEEWAERTFRPEKWAARQREERERGRLARKGRKRHRG